MPIFAWNARLTLILTVLTGMIGPWASAFTSTLTEPASTQSISPRLLLLLGGLCVLINALLAIILIIGRAAHIKIPFVIGFLALVLWTSMRTQVPAESWSLAIPASVALFMLSFGVLTLRKGATAAN